MPRDSESPDARSPAEATGRAPVEPPVVERVERVEDRTAFTEHTVDQLNHELVRAVGVIERMTKRIERLERRIADLERAGPHESLTGVGVGVVHTDGAQGGGGDDTTSAPFDVEMPPHSTDPDHRRAARRAGSFRDHGNA